MQVSGLWRYPVKSMAGEALTSLSLDRGGPRGDRLWAARDVERGAIASARRLPGLLLCAARYRAEPDGTAGADHVPPVIVTLPDGTEVASDDPAVHAALSSALDRDLQLVALSADPRSVRLPWRERLTGFTPAAFARDFGLVPGDRVPRLNRLGLGTLFTLARYSTPPGRFVDVSPVHVLTEASLAAVGAVLDGDPLDPRRFRPNVVLSGADGASALPELGWAGGALTIGAARLHVTTPTVRCVVPSRPQVDVALDKRVTRAVAGVGDRFLGAYGDVVRPGVLALHDDVRFTEADPPSSLRRAATRTREIAGESVFRVADLALRARPTR